jgi:hypothetical protein
MKQKKKKGKTWYGTRFDRIDGYAVEMPAPAAASTASSRVQLLPGRVGAHTVEPAPRTCASAPATTTTTAEAAAATLLAAERLNN